MTKYYLLCARGFEGMRIFGLFTDVDKLKEAYDQVQENDFWVKGEDSVERLEVYDMKLNEFTVEPVDEKMEEWDWFSYMELLDEVAIETICKIENK